MLTDLRTISWAEWKNTRANLIYWMRVLGWDPTSSGFYRAYFLLFWAFWVFSMWQYTLGTFSRITPAIPRDSLQQLFDGMPILMLVATLLFFAFLLRRSPLQLSAPEMEMVVSSPIRRGAVVILHYAKMILIPTGIIAALISMITMFLTWQINEPYVGVAGLLALLVTIPLVLTTTALLWALLLLKLHPERRQLARFVWVFLPILALVGFLVPEIGQWAGRIWQAAALEGNLTILHGVLLIGLTVVSFLLLWLSGDRVHMTLVADDSRTYARIHSLGLLGRMYSQELIAQVHRQNKLMFKKTLRLKLPAGGKGDEILRNRSLLAIFRLSPMTILTPYLRGLLTMLLFMVVIAFSGALAIQTWLLVLLFFLFVRPKELVSIFRQDIGQVFMSQLIRQDHLARYTTGQLFPLFLTVAGSFAAFMLHPGTDMISGLLLIVLVIYGLGLSQALEIVEDATVIFRPIPYEYTVLIGGALTIGAGMIFHSAVAAVIVLGLVDAIYAMLLANSRT